LIYTRGCSVRTGDATAASPALQAAEVANVTFIEFVFPVLVLLAAVIFVVVILFGMRLVVVAAELVVAIVVILELMFLTLCRNHKCDN
jgi:hypothetical protein